MVRFSLKALDSAIRLLVRARLSSRLQPLRHVSVKTSISNDASWRSICYPLLVLQKRSNQICSELCCTPNFHLGLSGDPGQQRSYQNFRFGFLPPSIVYPTRLVGVALSPPSVLRPVCFPATATWRRTVRLR